MVLRTFIPGSEQSVSLLRGKPSLHSLASMMSSFNPLRRVDTRRAVLLKILSYLANIAGIVKEVGRTVT